MISKLFPEQGQTINVKDFIWPTDENGQRLEVPDLTSGSMDNDLVLMELEESIIFSDNVKPIGLPTDSSFAPADGTMCAISGWGMVSDSKYKNISQWFPK